MVVMDWMTDGQVGRNQQVIRNSSGNSDDDGGGGQIRALVAQGTVMILHHIELSLTRFGDGWTR